MRYRFKSSISRGWLRLKKKIFVLVLTSVSKTAQILPKMLESVHGTPIQHQTIRNRNLPPFPNSVPYTNMQLNRCYYTSWIWIRKEKKKKKYYNISKKKYLLKGNVRPCLLICSSTSELQSVLRTMKGGEQILSSNKKRSKTTREELMKLKCGNKYSLKAKKRSWKVSVKQK